MVEKNKNKNVPKRKKVDSPFAKTLNRILKDRGITLRAASEMANVPLSTIADWTSGSSPSDLNGVARLAKALGVSFEFLCLGKEETIDRKNFQLSDLFEETKAFDGIYRITATKLEPKKDLK
jgi:transcriptional regulator with XRE-family HTH domain